MFAEVFAELFGLGERFGEGFRAGPPPPSLGFGCTTGTLTTRPPRASTKDGVRVVSVPVREVAMGRVGAGRNKQWTAQNQN